MSTKPSNGNGALAGGNAASACELKGGRFPLTVVTIQTTDIEAVGEALAAKRRQGGHLLSGAPVALDLAPLAGAATELDLPALVATVRRHDLVPVAVLSNGAVDDTAIRQAELACLSPPARRHSAPSAAGVGHTHRRVTRPVRSGQQIYAQGRDLVVTGAVSSGAELLADGSIHCYGRLRGKALAGASGDTDARIFCLCFEAELVSIAGVYRVIGDQEAGLMGRAVQVQLSGDRLQIAPL